ncbi:hypothetical protein E0F76_00045 [Flavobacterium cellulosilyticum]|uniref:CPBP family intramembrane metalloprotease n=1 Tax=Flavobacterium cellulosilyticum TaxID=2541731 RepID=A0A4R5CHE0_9FLAO|nr:hypothetical protein [Flavobacterium cellulosilyticum]TDD99155.1 hypothetical protein E0F76_00045 [Flavobacterium cellulosilyticum]
MLKNIGINFQKKSPNERFLFIIGILFFFVYLLLGLIVIFWNFLFPQSFPIEMTSTYRVSFGVVLIVYSFFRFFRFFNSNNN